APDGGGARATPPAISASDFDEEERRIVTVLFADIVGFTTLSERLDPEDVRELVAEVFGQLTQAVRAYGGTIDKFIGDALMALFGAPVAHEDDPQRAVSAALAMVQAVARLDLTDRDGRPIRLKLRIGINSGEVVAGARDVGGHREYSVFGDVVNTAARLQTVAEPGTILIGEQTARQAGALFRLEPTEPLHLRGREQPVRAYRVAGTVAEPSAAFGSGNGAPRGRLVDRQDELRRLREQVAELSRGRGGIASIFGEHGVGKSRLVEEVRAYAEELGLRWVECSAPSYGQGVSYRTFREVVAALFGFGAEDADELIAARLRDGLRDLQIEPALPYLGAILGLPIDSSPTDELGAQQLQRRAFSAVRRLLFAVAERQPLVLVLDDFERADPSSVDLLKEMLDLSDEVPLFFCYVYTPERDEPAWELKELAARAFPHRYTELTLGPLPPDAALALVGELLGSDELPARLVDRVLAKAEGNAFFIEEILRRLVDDGALRRDGDRWVADHVVRAVQLPDTLLAAVTARIDRLPEGVRRTLQVAAIIGHEFSERVLRRVTGGGAELDRHLRAAQRAGLVRELAAIPERRYAFRQALIQEAAARSLLLRRRREVHVQVGWALEEIYADSLEEQYASLASHFFEGEAWERAFRYGSLAAKRAAAAYANDEAVANYTIAIEAAARSAAGANPEVVAQLREQRGDVRALVGSYAEALTDYRAALERHHSKLRDAAEASEDQLAEASHTARLALKLARLHSYRGEADEMVPYLELARANLPPDSPDVSALAALEGALLLWRADVERAVEAGRRSLAIAEERGSHYHVGKAYELLTHPSLIGVTRREALDYAARWIRLAREQQDRPMLFRALVAEAFINIWGLMSFDERLAADVEEAQELAGEIGSVAAVNTVDGILGAGYTLLGRWREAEELLRRVDGQPTALDGITPILQYWLAHLLTLRGAVDEAADKMRAWLAGPPNLHRRVVMNALLALNRRLAGDEDEARAAMARAEQAEAELSCSHCDVTLAATAAEFYAENGDPAVAARYAARGRALAEAFGREVGILAADRADAILALRAGEPDRAVALLEGALAGAERMGQPYELGLTLHALGRVYRARRGDVDAERAHATLTRALELFERLGAKPAAEVVRAALSAPAGA
ncbi:MAG: AAA family ATPase, partial [Chloroflexota bacterium]|nr:AAA family ATPase [Chloroflexota bacterium]